jgi:hypothetical protein
METRVAVLVDVVGDAGKGEQREAMVSGGVGQPSANRINVMGASAQQRCRTSQSSL